MSDLIASFIPQPRNLTTIYNKNITQRLHYLNISILTELFATSIKSPH